MRVFLLTEVMRMTAGLEDICNTILYSSKLVRGPGTSLDDPNRKLSQDLSNIAKAFPILTREPEGLVYPIFFDVRGHCIQEPNGSSRVNGYNISFIIAWIKRLLKQIDLGLTASDIGVATPYAGQVRATRLFTYQNLFTPKFLSLLFPQSFTSPFLIHSEPRTFIEGILYYLNPPPSHPKNLLYNNIISYIS